MLKGEKEIDVNQINRERSMATVDEEEHAVLDRLTFDYHQKLQGKPQSHEMVRSFQVDHGFRCESGFYGGGGFPAADLRGLSLQKVHEMLKRGWDAEGSPFKGQQFDPSLFDIPPSAVQF